MAIASLNDYIGSAKQRLAFDKVVSRTAVATGWFSLFDVAGNPGAGTLAGTSAGTGVVPTDATAGYPTINAFGGGATGYISRVEFSNSVACRIALYDRLYVCGAHAFNANQAMTTPPSYAGRLPGTDYGLVELWVEQVTAATGNQAVTVTYTNQSGTASRSTGAVGIGAAPTVGRCWQLPLQAGDTGLQSIQNVLGTVASVGTFNVMVMRPVWTGRVKVANDGDVHDMLRTGLPRIYDDAALFVMVAPDSTATGIPDMLIEIANA